MVVPAGIDGNIGQAYINNMIQKLSSEREGCVMSIAVLRYLCGLLLFIPLVSTGADVNFQNYLFLACQSAQGALQQRCQETDQGLGNVSGDSESSLNPTQALAAGELEWRQSASDDDLAGAQMELGKWSVSVQAYSGSLEREPSAKYASRAYDVDLSGVSVSLARLVGESGAVQLAFEQTKRDGSFAADQEGRNFVPWSTAGELDYDTVGFSLLYSHAVTDDWSLDIGLGRSNQDISITRRSVFQESNRVVGQVNSLTAGDFEADIDWWGVSTAYDLRWGAFTLRPEASWTAREKTVDAYTERDLSNTGLNMQFSGATTKSDLTTLGLSGLWTLNRSSGVYLPHVRTIQTRESLDSGAPLRVRYVAAGSADALLISPDSVGKDMLKVTVGLSAVHPMGWSWFVDYADIVDGDDLDGWQFSAGIRKEL